jgi:DNA repair protein RecO (recombination protein O)
MPITYFCLWMNRLMGWMPELGACIVCGESLRGKPVYYSPTADGVTCFDDRRPNSLALSPLAVAEAHRIFRGTVAGLAEEDWPRQRALELRRFALDTLERHLERQLKSARALSRT